ncbi:MAG: rhomboid family intramembrane serine protease [Cyclobacteriaceae bacterium]|nr:rhomboid family intramembrane serine protease [Cyclobacteriaceae bacterium]
MNLTLLIIIAISLISLLSLKNVKWQNRMIFNPYMIYTKKQYDRFLLSGFIHKDLVHLLFNMIALYFFGNVVENDFYYLFGYLGYIYYIILFAGGIIIADIPNYFKYRKESFYNSLGSSGGVSAVLFAAILHRPTSSICLYFAICIPAFILGALYLIYSLYLGKKMSDHINHDAHFYGALYGVVLTILLRPAVLVSFVEKIIEFATFW